MLECTAEYAGTVRLGLEDGFVQRLDYASQGARIELHDDLSNGWGYGGGCWLLPFCRQLVLVYVDRLRVQVQLDRDLWRHLGM